MLGIFTVVTTIHQQNVTKQQRDEDQRIARDQRQLNKNIADEQYQSQIFDAFIKETGELLEKNNGSLKYNSVTASVARAKTLNVLHQLGPQHNSRIIRFLYEAGQLLETPENRPLDLSAAELRDIDFRRLLLANESLDKISLAGVLLHNVTFTASVNFGNAYIFYTELMQAHCIEAHFVQAILLHSTFSHANAKSAAFYRANLTDVDFSFANLYNADFADTQITDSELWSALSIRDALLPNGTIARDPNLIKNGEADCNISLVDHW
ncbi:unnamed protein product, partial [Rotaria magnacalcarata]